MCECFDMELEPVSLCVSKPEQGKSRLLKAALGVCVCLGIVLLLALIVVSQRANPEEFCLTPQCVEAAGSILSKMDRAVSPCEDFYRFSCGGWLKENPIPEDSSSYGIYPWLRQQVDIRLKDLLESKSPSEEIEAVRKAKVLYRSCMDEAVVEKVDCAPLLKLLQQSEFRWPVLEGLGREWLWSQEQWDLLKTLALIRNQHGKSVLIRLFIAPDDKNSTHYIIKLDQASLFLSREDYITNTSSAQTYRSALLNLMVDIAVMLGAPQEAAETQMKDALTFETKLAKIVIPFENRTSENLYNRYTISRLQRSVPQFDWLSFITSIIDSADEGLSVSSSEPVIVRTPTYFKQLFKLLNTTEPRTVSNYVIWRTVFSRITSLSRRFLYRYLDFARVTTGTTSLTPRWDKCVNYIENTLVYATGRLFIDTHFQEDKKHMMEELIEGVRWAFINMLERENDWMDEPTRKKAIEKAHSVLAKVGYPQFILNDTYINEDIKQISSGCGGVSHVLSELHTNQSSVPHTELHTNQSSVPHTELHNNQSSVPRTELHNNQSSVPRTELHTNQSSVPRTELHNNQSSVPRTELHNNQSSVPRTELHNNQSSVPRTELHNNQSSVPRTELHNNQSSVPRTELHNNQSSVPRTELHNNQCSVPRTELHNNQCSVPRTELHNNQCSVPRTELHNNQSSVPHTEG
ncbi:phosphate-regulating neutral endopeptidase PHEX isoform X5 [Esox lucius]|uniref:phosphate-regulating neutral endopeptidase PHEX isoform X5 n=1 Tax=Esox lucius TaxID=8010 RepID=UPI001476DE99|nr:phosphate-regulating neutral endopeptidase PHEX isoform X5 [Esox lucius]